MKKSKLLTTPTRLSDLSFDDLYVDDSDVSLKTERWNNKKRREFNKQEHGTA